MSSGRLVMLIVEDRLGEALLRRAVACANPKLSVDRCLVTGGFGRIKAKVDVYRRACRVLPHVVLTDLDRAACAPSLLAEWGVTPAPREFLFGVAVREVEAWLLADIEGVAAWLSTSPDSLPRDPESLPDPKATLLRLARRSRHRDLIADICPAPGSRVHTGPRYNERLGRFASYDWNPQRAATRAPSLDRALRRLATFLD